MACSLVLLARVIQQRYAIYMMYMCTAFLTQPKRLSHLLGTYLPHSRDATLSDTLLQPSEDIDSLIILDRRVDMVTPLLTQLTYEGLMDELLGIKNCKGNTTHIFIVLDIAALAHVEVPASLLTQPSEPNQANPAVATNTQSANALRREAKKKYHLNETDILFAELRDLNFSFVGKRLNRLARRIEEDYKVRLVPYGFGRKLLTSRKASLQAKTIAQLKDVVGKLGGLKNEHQSLRIRQFV
jgi:vacuolar protein sorting-associated protein 33A